MSSIIQPPAAGTAFVGSTEDKDHPHHGGYRNDGYDYGRSNAMENAILREVAAGSAAAALAARGIMADVKDAERAVMADVKDARCEVLSSVADVKCSVTDTIKDTRADLSVNAARHAAEAALSFRHTNDVINLGFANVQAKLSALELSQSAGFAAAQLLACQIEGRAMLEASRNAAAAELTATKNAAALAAQIAECCCETKALIREEGTATRALINANVAQELRDKLATANTQLAAYFTAAKPPVFP